VIPELGTLALAFALVFSLLQSGLAFAGAARARGRWIGASARAAIAQGAAMLVAFACLAASFVDNDFSVQAVARHSNSSLPAFYRFAATWGSHEGSMLLWSTLLAAWSAAVVAATRAQAAVPRARVLGVLGVVAAGQLAFVLGTSNPFARLFPAALEGRDLNPLLQDPGMAIHPPLLYMGYVGCAVAYAFAMAGLGEAAPDAAHRRSTRRWAACAWAFLTAGIALGSAWAYRELGWGGWWFWDPVENASLMPWLAATALLHALAAPARRGGPRAWAPALAAAAFVLALGGTFLMRSGVLTSVHAFAVDPARGVFILALVGVAVAGSVIAIGRASWRATATSPSAPSPSAPSAPSAASAAAPPPAVRDALMLAHVLLMTVACASVMLGTLYPLAFEVLGIGRLSVGAQYFETVLLPVVVPVALLAGWAPLLAPALRRWPQAARAAAAPALVAAAVCALAAWRVPGWSPVALTGVFCAAWLAAATLAAFVAHARRAGLPGASRAGAVALAHLGLAVFVAGITVAKSRALEQDVRLAIGESAALGDLRFTLTGFGPVPGPNYDAVRATVAVTRAGAPVATLLPEKRVYRAQPGTPMTEAAVDAGVAGDIYVSLGEPSGPRAWTLRLQTRPLVGWIWAGCALMAAGGFLAAFLPRRSHGTFPSAQ